MVRHGCIFAGELIEFAGKLEENPRIRITWGALETAEPVPPLPPSPPSLGFLEAFQTFPNTQPRLSTNLEEHFPPGDPVKRR